MAIEQRVKEIVSEQLDVEKSELGSGTSFGDDLGADSLDVVELIMALEEEFEMEIEDEDAAKLLTVGDIVQFIKSKIQ